MPPRPTNQLFDATKNRLTSSLGQPISASAPPGPTNQLFGARSGVRSDSCQRMPWAYITYACKDVSYVRTSVRRAQGCTYVRTNFRASKTRGDHSASPPASCLIMPLFSVSFGPKAQPPVGVNDFRKIRQNNKTKQTTQASATKKEKKEKKKK